jgi:UDP-glucose 4-epimerase
LKALVTGGNGFLGHYLVKELYKKGIETVILDILKPDEQYTADRQMDGLHWITGDIRDTDLLDSAMQGCDLVFHTAAIADIDEARNNPVSTLEINVIGTAKCLDAARKAGVKRFIYASSVYTAGNKGSIYRVSKQAGESLCKTYLEEYGLEYTIMRYGSLYGSESNPWNPIYRICKSILTTGTYTYSSSPDSVREYIHIRDAARETVRIATDPAFANKSVMISGHQRIKISELFFMIQEILGKEVRISYKPSENRFHYVMTPYSFEADVPMRVNLSTYVDISEGILDCLRAVRQEMSTHDTDNS